ncbi:MAG: AraC family transcriptional regulator [Planctomycetia bacterium]|nr:AraC family transcriptional regulator [Planctomycetia bacterium]
MDAAKTLLATTLLPVYTIASQTGFEPNYFLKAFRQVTGTSPKTWRKNHKEFAD